jgi:glycosyltransferase involved in cell wall biosynthesis
MSLKSSKFESLSVILPVMNETAPLEKTVEIIMSGCGKDISQIIIVVSSRTTPESRAVCEKIKRRYGGRVYLFEQVLPFLGGAIRDSFARVKGSHVLMMASDMETPPERVRDFIREAKKDPDMIITGSRWIKGGGFEGYSFLKYVLNFMFQRVFSLLYGVRLTDMTYGYRVFPADLVKSIRWEELRHPFLFETLVKPIRLGVKIKEIPTEWKAREEGESQNPFLRNFEYFRIGLRTLFYSRRAILQ